MLLDIRYALRRFRREAGFSLAAILVVSLAVGANTTIFTIVNSLLLKEIPGVSEPRQLVEVGRTQGGEGMDTESYPDFVSYRKENSTLESLAAWTFASVNFSPGEGAIQIHGLVVSGNYFSTLGARPFLGRFFSPEEDVTPATHPVLVVSHEFWTESLGADRGSVGKDVQINGQDFVLIGVTAPGFYGTIAPFHPDFWAPIMMLAAVAPGETDTARSSDTLASRGSNWLFQFGRLRSGVTPEQASADLNNIAQRLEQDYPEANREQGVGVERLGALPSVARMPATALMALLFGATGALFLVAGVNISGLLLSRMMGRRDELAVRLAVGSPQWRITRQLLTETVLLFGAGGLLGLLLAAWAGKLLQAFQPPTPFPIHLSGTLDYCAALFGLLLSVGCGLLFGIMPVRLATREALADLLREYRGGSRKVSRLRNAFVTAQVSLSLMLLFMAGLFLRSIQETAALDLGFDPENVWTAQVDLSLNGYSDAQGQLFFRRMLEETRRIPGVESASLAVDLPLDGARMGLGGIAGEGDRESFIGANFNIVSSGYLETLRIPVLRGRSFVAQDTEGSSQVVIVNQSAAQRLWPSDDPIGKRLWIGDLVLSQEYLVVGLVQSGRVASLTEVSEPQVYLPLFQQPRSQAYIVLRSGVNPLPVARQILQDMDSAVPLVRPAALSEVNQIATLVQRIVGAVSGAVGLVALLLAAIGVFALSSYAATNRTREFGIRLALGAKPKQILGLVTRQGLTPALVGAGLGLLLSLCLGNLLKDFLIGVHPSDLLAFLASSGLLIGVVAIAALVPARQAARLDPIKALRYE